MIHTRSVALRITTLLGLILLVGVALLGPVQAKKVMAPAADRVEARIKSLHNSLRITAAQEPLWDNVANAMRDNSRAMMAAREQQPVQVSAIDDLKAYGNIIDAHADGIHKFIPVFEALYDSMSDTQKKNADAVFSERVRQAAQRNH